jgi:hypothetical protein
MCCALCDGNVNAQYLLVLIGSDSSVGPPFSESGYPDVSFITGKTPETETTIDIGWEPGYQFRCGQKKIPGSPPTWIDDARYGSIATKRPFFGVLGVSSTMSTINKDVFYKSDSVKEFGTQYELLEEINDPVNGWISCQDNADTPMFYYKYCACRNKDCS